MSLFFSCPLFKSFHIARQTCCSKRITVLYPHLIYSAKKRISFQFQEQSSSKVVFLCSTRTSRYHKLEILHQRPFAQMHTDTRSIISGYKQIMFHYGGERATKEKVGQKPRCRFRPTELSVIWMSNYVKC